MLCGAVLLAGCAGGTTAATNVTRVTATLNAKGSCAGGPCSWYFRYGTDNQYQYQTPVHEITTNTNGETVTLPGEKISGLVPGTTYQYQLCGKGDGVSTYRCVGPDGSTGTSGRFTTLDAKADCLYGANNVSTLASFGARVGHRFQCAMVFANANSQWANWETPWFTSAGHPSAENFNWQDWKNCVNRDDPCVSGERRQLIITTELWPDSEDGDDPLVRCSQGAYNSHAASFATNLVNDGLGNSVIRIEQEGNGTSSSEDLPSDGADGLPTTREEREWARCWRKEALAMKRVPGAHFLMDWTVNAGFRPIPPASWYPGDRAVDIIGIDAYEIGLGGITSEPAAWKKIFTQADGIRSIQRFAAEHGKPMSFPEWGLGDAGAPDHGLGDDPVYIDNIAAIVRVTRFAYQAYFLHLDAGALLDGGAPLSLARYIAHFGGGGDTTGHPTILP